MRREEEREGNEMLEERERGCWGRRGVNDGEDEE